MAGATGSAGWWAHPEGSGAEGFKYGTAGFRTRGETLEGVAFRMGLFMAVRSTQVRNAPVGIMISASHNAHPDNGLKLVDAGGAMLPSALEPDAEAVANAGSQSEVASALQKTFGDEWRRGGGSVFVGRDTRATGARLAKAVADGVAAGGGKVKDYGVVTTPMLHYFVWKEGGSEEGYVEEAAAAFGALLPAGAEGATTVSVDCANGVGALKAGAVFAAVEQNHPGYRFLLENTRTDVHEALNQGCGADFVQKEKQAPPRQHEVPATRYASLDGDADRLVYYVPGFRLVDGDRIAVLYCALVKSLFAALPQATRDARRIGIVQTAYANGGSTCYMREVLGVPVDVVPTGVKHLHHKALDYDVGIYFEANGHGTVLLSASFQEELRGLKGAEAAAKLLAVAGLASPVCGDAVLDLLLVEAALANLEWGVDEWLALYPDAPSRMTKVAVPDPQLVQTVWNQTRATHPAGMQDAIDSVVASAGSSARAFVRPSGTEPIVRVYAEAASQQTADALATQVESVVKKFLA